jgi:UDP-N-acetylglucosamine 2-epimerase
VKIVSVIASRPQLVKCSALSAAVRLSHREILVHTGQPYESEPADESFAELNLPTPDHHLGVGAASEGAQTGLMLQRIEHVLLAESPDLVLVYGDTNSALAAALAAAKLEIPVAHVEAGLRSFARTMPEEINRVVTDHVASLLFCPSEQAVANLADEGITAGVHVSGDVTLDAVTQWAAIARAKSTICDDLGINPGGYVLATVHRAQNTDDQARLQRILAAFENAGHPVVLPVHPRTRHALTTMGWQAPAGSALRMISPVGFLDMLRLEQSARCVVTDSGGVQKEAYWLGVPCVTLRKETEWSETVAAGWNQLVDADHDAIVAAVRGSYAPPACAPLYGQPGASLRIVKWLQ